MPTYVVTQGDILGPDINTVQQQEPAYGMEKPDWYAPLNPFDHSNATRRLREAAFNIDNSLGSWIASAPFNQFPEQQGYNPFDEKGAALQGYEDYADAFINSGSPQETTAIKQRIDRQLQDRQFLSEAGAAGTVSSMAMGMIDPINVASMYVPVGMLARGASVARTAARFALANAAGGVASELSLQATQETRTAEESVINVMTDAMVGGILGSASQLVANIGTRQAINKSVAQTLGDTLPPDRSIGAAEVFNTTLDQEQLKGVGLINKTLSVTPSGRLAQSPAHSSRVINQMLAENNYTFAKNEEGLATATAAETRIKQYDTLLYKQMETTKDHYQQYSKAAPRDKRMSFIEFNEAVGKAMRRGDKHNVPEIAQAAARIRPLFEATKKRMQELNILGEDVEVTTAESYLPRIYKFDKILSDRSRFRGILTNWLKSSSARTAEIATERLNQVNAGLETARAAGPEAEALAARIAEAERWSGKNVLLMDEIQKQRRKAGKRAGYEEQLAGIKDPDKQAKRKAWLERQLQGVEEAERKVTELQGHLEILNRPRRYRNRLRGLEKRAGSVERLDASRQRQIVASEPISAEEAEAIADEIINKIIGAPSGIVPRELIPEGLTKRAGFSKSRTLTIPDKEIEDFLESDINYVTDQYLREVAPEIELTAQFGRKDMGEQIRQVSEEYSELIRDAKTPRQRARLEKQREADVRDIEAMRDRLIGTYGAPKDPRSFFIRAGRIARKVNFLRLLGGMTVSALPDLARPIMQHGLAKSLKPLGVMLKNVNAAKVANADLREMAVGLEYVLSTRTKSLSELHDPYSRRSYLERGLNWTTQKFGNYTLMNQWNGALKAWSGMVVQSRILDNARLLQSGKTLPKSEIKKLAQLGIDKTMLGRIGREFAQHGEDMDGLLTGHSHLWGDPVVRDAFQSAVLKDVDSVVVTPGVGDTPLMMSGETGKMIMQFKTFIFAAHNRVLVSGIQQGDAAFYYGALMQIALGAGVYAMKQKLAGRDVDYSPNNLVKEGLDRSGMLGWLSEPLNTVESVSGGRFGLGAMFGAPPVSRFQSRNAIGAMLGPTFDLGGDMATIANGVLNGEFDDKQTHAVRKMLPFQNLFFIAPALNRVEEELK
ncbi:hypothetical protein [Pantoea sp. BAV 3049]|uniref:hypothetical protein n=1 Tax=Pantoea sp. BAV 3049 TaxID=2654188 RepID=UPI00131E5B20|nr:hypothetical protein [Pantoea sp. BAV 3049]